MRENDRCAPVENNWLPRSNFQKNRLPEKVQQSTELKNESINSSDMSNDCKLSDSVHQPHQNLRHTSV